MVLITNKERGMDIQKIHYEAKCAAAEAARARAAQWGDDWGMCGFAWIKIYRKWRYKNFFRINFIKFYAIVFCIVA